VLASPASASRWRTVVGALCALSVSGGGVTPAHASSAGSACSTAAKPDPESIYTGGNAREIDPYWLKYTVRSKDGRYRLRLRSGAVTSAKFDSIEQYSARLFHVVRGTCHGIISATGRVVVPVEYIDILTISARALLPPKGTPTVMKASRGDVATAATIFAIDESTFRVFETRTLDAAYAELVPVGRRWFVRIQSADGGYGLLDSSLRTLLEGQFSVDLVGLGDGGLAPYTWLATTPQSASVLDETGLRITVNARSAKQVWFYNTVMQSYLAVLDTDAGECRYITKRGLQPVVVPRTFDATESNCPEFRDFVVAVTGSNATKAPSTWRILKLVDGLITTTATFPDAVSVFDLGPPNGAPVSAPHEFRVTGVAGVALRYVDENGREVP
jgi:hypothetical protein